MCGFSGVMNRDSINHLLDTGERYFSTSGSNGAWDLRIIVQKRQVKVMKESLLNFDGWLDQIPKHKQSGRRGVPRGVQSVWHWKGETHRIDQWICDQSWRSHCSHSIWGLQDMLGFLFFSLDPLRPLPVSHSSHCSVAVSTGQPYFAAKRFCLSFCFHCSLEKITSKEWDQQFYQAPDEAKPVTVHPLYILWTKKTRYTFGHPDLLSMAVPNSAGHLKLDHQTHLNSFGLKSKVNGRMTGVT